MKRVQINLRESHESDYGWKYIEPYIYPKGSQKQPVYMALEQIFREHQRYKKLALEEQSFIKQLETMEKEIHYDLLRTSDAEKNVRTLLYLWNNYYFEQGKQDYIELSTYVTPPVQEAMKEVDSYYQDLAAKKRSRNEMLNDKKTEDGHT
ncbi:hypothetical protein LQF60_09060 [Tetragenococcus koreensis]|uniref:hypothetical protein n=1 Tax=Tetragenococcus TaxID=51668 RepID=UPI001F3948AA|nr:MULTISPECIES: hypothetical protein [Tetragenococcus]MCF1585714.1 hypothetical protein [Tetragenococcus koreensis]MCF1615347.1 hypothetical protein [Tetragenococcus koreensis]MCF1625144.1 hypothetical protein [Tetragenococcus koreensis]MCF1629980.1 hypothetical protein [Tetragenococcus koreensis]MCF1642866.1 hypothetical protein [Tetragenococcus koreensis]